VKNHLKPLNDEKRGYFNGYDPRKRDPQFAKAENTCLWELNELGNHYHPSVMKFAKQLIGGEYIKYESDPIIDFSLASFLDRFIYKNPKKRVSEGSNPLLQRHIVSRFVVEQPVNHPSFLTQKTIPEDEFFFYKYFKQKENETKKSKKTKKETKVTDEINFDDSKKKNRSEIDEPKEFDYDQLDEDDSDDDFDEDENEGMNGAFDPHMFDDIDPNDPDINDFRESTKQTREDSDGGSVGSSFADADEFAHLLDSSNTEGVHPKHLQWEQKKNVKQKGGQKSGQKNMKRKWSSEMKNPNQKQKKRKFEHKNFVEDSLHKRVGCVPSQLFFSQIFPNPNVEVKSVPKNT